VREVYLITEDQLLRLQASVCGAQFFHQRDLENYNKIIELIKSQPLKVPEVPPAPKPLE
jgi:hypothetical protein